METLQKHDKVEEEKNPKQNKRMIPIAGKCIFPLPKKPRLCFQVINPELSENYCRFHLGEESIHHENQTSLGKDNKKYEMVYCPYEPKNAVQKHKLEEHLKTCPKKRELEQMEMKTWFKRGINFINMDYVQQNHSQLKDIEKDLIDKVIEKVLQLYDKLSKEHKDNVHLKDLFIIDQVMDDYKKKIEESETLKVKMFEPEQKHSNQQNKIVDIMKERGVLANEDENKLRIFVEYGAGRAGLSAYVADRIKQETKKESVHAFIIVDRDTRRNKHDKNFRDTFLTIREKMDIADFDLQKFVEESDKLKDKNVELMCIAKHLCGGATDLSLTSIISRQSKPIGGVAIASCCHHCCDLKTYVNQKFWNDQGFDNKEYEILPRLSSWAITQTGTSLEKKSVGLKVKRLLDFGRLMYLKEHIDTQNLKMEYAAYQYCDPLLESPENMLLMMFPK